MTTLIFGKSGQLGEGLAEHLPGAVLLGQAEADFAKPALLPDILEKYRPTAIYNAAAYTAVDKAEAEPELAFAINAESPAVLAEYAAEADIPLIHYSTDYVYDGSGTAPRDENTPPAPLNVYGKTKLAGDAAIQASGCRHLIFRTSWVYDATGKNFVNTMLRLAAERPEIKVVADQFGAPTYAPHLAKASITALENAQLLPAFPSGVYHLCNQGETSWFGFAEAILSATKLIPIPTADYPTPARRPLNSRLSCEKVKIALGITMPPWQEGLAECMKAIHAR